MPRCSTEAASGSSLSTTRRTQKTPSVRGAQRRRVQPVIRRGTHRVVCPEAPASSLAHAPGPTGQRRSLSDSRMRLFPASAASGAAADAAAGRRPPVLVGGLEVTIDWPRERVGPMVLSGMPAGIDAAAFMASLPPELQREHQNKLDVRFPFFPARCRCSHLRGSASLPPNFPLLAQCVADATADRGA